MAKASDVLFDEPPESLSVIVVVDASGSGPALRAGFIT